MVRNAVLGVFVLILFLGAVSAFSVSLEYPVAGSNYSVVVEKIDWSLSGINVSGLSSCWYTLDGGVTNVSSSDCSDFSYTTLINSTEGNNKWVIYANDSSGVVQSDSVAFWVDSIFPNLSINSPIQNPAYTNSNSMTISALLVESNPLFDFFGRAVLLELYYNGVFLNNWMMGFDSSTNISSFSLDSNDLVGDGNYSYKVISNDTIGHKTIEIGSFIIDKVAPLVSLISPSMGGFYSDNLAISANASDDRSGVDRIELEVMNSSLDILYNLSCLGSSCGSSWNSSSAVDGEYSISAKAYDKAGNSNSVYANVSIDNNPPVVIFASPSSGNYSYNVSVIVNASDTNLDFIELYITGTKVNSSSSEIVSYYLGEGDYSVYGVAYDKAGNNASSAVRDIRVDLTPPIISSLSLSSAYISPIDSNGVFDSLVIVMNASELVDWSRTEIINSSGDIVKYFNGPSGFVSTNTEVWGGVDSSGDFVSDGNYTINTSFSDIAGNSNEIILGSVVVDNTKPVIVLNGGNVFLEVFSPYSEQGANATDNYDGDLTGSVVIAGGVNMSVLGSYNISYSVNDSAGNSANVVRSVDVVDTTSPAISLFGGNPEIVELGSLYVESGAMASDNYDGNISGSIIIDSSAVDVNTVGNYSVNYSVSDSSGNTGFASRIVQVSDTTVPSLSLGTPGNNVPISLSGNNVTFSVEVVDASSIVGCDLILNNTVNKTNSTIVGNASFDLFDLSPGKYVWSVSCTDSSGNVGVSGNSSFTILSDLTFPAGTEATDLSLESDISAVSGFYVKNQFGMINWTGLLDLSSGKNWADYINLSFNSGEVNSTGAGELNDAARITFFNLTFSNPRVLRDQTVCTDCAEISYFSGIFVFDVTGFSLYESEETPVDSGGGFSSSSSGGGGGSGGGTASKIDCLSIWDCGDWGSCLSGEQTRICTLKPGITPGQCEVDPDNPPGEVTTQSCEAGAEEFLSSGSGNSGGAVFENTTAEQGGFFQTITGAITGISSGSRIVGMMVFLTAIALLYMFVVKKRKRSFAKELEKTFGGK